MDAKSLGSLWPVSALTIGGGGIGQVWGPTSQDEAVATVRASVDGGITLIDVAPTYGDGEAEEVVGLAFDGRLPEGVKVSTKYHVGHDPVDVEAELLASLEESRRRLRLDVVDLFILHSQILPWPDPERETWTIPLQVFEDVARPALQKLVDDGHVGSWGITATQFPEVLESVFSARPTPQVAQMVANVIDSPGDMAWTPIQVGPRELIALAKQAGVGVMGIRAVQAGALTDSLDRDLPADHPARVDFDRAAPFRAVAAELGESPATLAHRYAMSIDGVDTVVLGVKNRTELAECLAAAEPAPSPPMSWSWSTRRCHLAAPPRSTEHLVCTALAGTVTSQSRQIQRRSSSQFWPSRSWPKLWCRSSSTSSNPTASYICRADARTSLVQSVIFE